MMRILWLVPLWIFSCQVFSASHDNMTLSEIKAYSLKYCLETNYEKLTVFSLKENLQDDAYQAIEHNNKLLHQVNKLHQFLN